MIISFGYTRPYLPPHGPKDTTRGWVTALLGLTDEATYSPLPDKTIVGSDPGNEFNPFLRR